MTEKIFESISSSTQQVNLHNNNVKDPICSTALLFNVVRKPTASPWRTVPGKLTHALRDEY